MYIFLYGELEVPEKILTEGRLASNNQELDLSEGKAAQESIMNDSIKLT